MDPMNKKNAAETESPIVDPFPKPQTIPSGWDLSELYSDTPSSMNNSHKGYASSQDSSPADF